MKKSLQVLGLVLAMFFATSVHAHTDRYVLNEDKAALSMVVDAVVVRPAYAVITAAGVAFFTITLPISAMSNSIDSAGEHLVRDPARNTFQRCLGCVEARRP